MRAQRRNAITPYSQEALAIRSFAYQYSLTEQIRRIQPSNSVALANNSEQRISVEERSNHRNNTRNLDSDTEEEDPSNPSSFAAASA